MSENKKLIPRRRFKGFEGAKQWKQSFFLGVIINIIDFRGRTPKKLGMDWSVCGFLALSALNVKNGYIDFSADAHYGDNNLYLKWMGGNELRKGQVIFTTEAPMGNVAQIPDDNGYILSQRVIAFEVNKAKITDDFLAISLKSPNVYNSLLMMTSGGTAKGISQKSLSTLKIHLPSSITEQTQIGEFFKKLDNLINTQQKKLEKAKTLKSAYLREMFPDDNESNPKRRFKGIKEDWVPYKLKDVIESEFKGKTKAIMLGNKSIYLDANYLNGGEISYVNASKDVNFNDVLILWDGSLAGTVYHGFEGALGSTLKAYRPKESGQFLYQYLKKNQQKIFDNYRTPNIPHVVKTFTEEFLVVIPHEQEQTKIGNFFKLLDHKIALEQKKLNKLKNIKQAYLNEMLV
jgi:type I restriction enzyme, S subunit